MPIEVGVGLLLDTAIDRMVTAMFAADATQLGYDASRRQGGAAAEPPRVVRAGPARASGDRIG
jgi:hypothetical protein